MDMVIERGGLRDATTSEYRNKATLLDVTRADPQAMGYMRTGNAERDRLAAFKIRGVQAQPLRSAGTRVLRRAQLQTRHPRGAQLWAPR